MIKPDLYGNFRCTKYLLLQADSMTVSNCVKMAEIVADYPHKAKHLFDSSIQALKISGFDLKFKNSNMPMHAWWNLVTVGDLCIIHIMTSKTTEVDREALIQDSILCLTKVLRKSKAWLYTV